MFAERLELLQRSGFSLAPLVWAAAASAGAALRVLTPAPLFAISGAALLAFAAIGALLTADPACRRLERPGQQPALVDLPHLPNS